MKFTALFTALALFAAPALADSLAYDTVYDKKSGSLATVACSDGSHGLLTRGYKTFGDLPTFPYIGAAGAVAGWNSPNCGTCWDLTYTDGQNKKHTITVTAIDHANPGNFNVALAAMNNITNGHAVEFGRVTVTSKQVAASKCGL